MLEQPNLDHINIWQQNTRKPLTVQLATLHSVEDKYDIMDSFLFLYHDSLLVSHGSYSGTEVSVGRIHSYRVVYQPLLHPTPLVFLS